jgi:quercetin dioxygenase-like cupin family protein
MTIRSKWVGVAVAVFWLASAGSRDISTGASANPSQDKANEQARLAFSHALPALEGGHVKVSVVEVTYGPGGSSPAHVHPCPVVGYVVSGAIRTQVKGEPEAVYNAGESFYEAPDGVHLISANASAKEPAKLIAFFICDHDAPLSVPVPEPRLFGGKSPRRDGW